MQNTMKFFLFSLLLFLSSGCVGDNNDTKNNTLSYRLVMESHDYHDESFSSDYNITYSYNDNNLLASTSFIYDSSTPSTTVFEYSFDNQNRLARQAAYWTDANNTKILQSLLESNYTDNRMTTSSLLYDFDLDGLTDMNETHFFDEEGFISNITIDWDWGDLYFRYENAEEAYITSFAFTFPYTIETLSNADGEIDLNATYTYNDAGLVTKRMVDYLNGQEDINTSYRYDISNRLVEINATSRNTLFVYDSDNHLVEKSIDNGATREEYSYTYNNKGKPASTTYTTSYGNYTSTYTYDAMGNLVKFESDFETLSYHYRISYLNRELKQMIEGPGFSYSLYELRYDENNNLNQLIYYDNKNLIPTKTSTYTWEKAE